MNIIVSEGVKKAYGARIRATDPQARFITVGLRDGALCWSGDPARADICCFSEDFWQDTDVRRHVIPALFTLQGLRWFHSFSAGIDSPAFAAMIERGTMLTRTVREHRHHPSRNT